MLTDVCRHAEAIPQYHLRHTDLIERLRAAVAHRPGLHLIGNYLLGVSLNDCVGLAAHTADDLIRARRPP